MLLLVGACGFGTMEAVESLDEPPVIGRVLLVDTEGVKPPPIPRHGLFQAESFFSIDAGAGPRAMAFVLTVALEPIGSVRVRVLHAETHESHELPGFSGDLPTSGPWDAQKFVAAADQARHALVSGDGVFTTRTIRSTDTTDWQRVGIILPESILSRTIRLTVFRRDADGTPVGGAELELAREFFHMAVIGDSIAWGNGLRREDKIPSLVGAVIERELGVRVIVQNLAQHAATLNSDGTDRACTAGCWGEVPTFRTSVRTQFSSLARPDSIDLLLLNGCINDVGLPLLLDPFTDATTLADRTARHCGSEMAEFLHEISTAAPQARVVVLGLYPIVSAQSDLLGVEQLRQIFSGDPVPVLDGLIASLSETSRIFVESGNTAMATAVEEANSSNGGRPIAAVAIPDFGPQNAVFARESWLWNMIPENETLGPLDIGFELLPEDPIARLRWQGCFERGQELNLITCLYSSVGHPRPIGAQAYAAAAIEKLRELGVLPAR